MHIDGMVTGDVTAADFVIVAPGGVVYGDVEATEVYVGGVVVGDIRAEWIELYDTGICHGRRSLKESGS